MFVLFDIGTMCLRVYTVPPEFGPYQPKLIQTVEDDVALLPLRVSANPDEISCEWIYQGETLAVGKEGGLIRPMKSSYQKKLGRGTGIVL